MPVSLWAESDNMAQMKKWNELKRAIAIQNNLLKEKRESITRKLKQPITMQLDRAEH